MSISFQSYFGDKNFRLPVYADIAITDNKLFIVSLDNLFGVLIESEDLAKTFKNFFLLAWRAGI